MAAGSFYGNTIKRFLDVVLSLCALVALSPVLLLIALLVRIKLGRPVIFRQERAGLIDGSTGREGCFCLFKFRSMRDANGPDGEPLPDTERLTAFGKWLRGTSLDELPELINILAGDMSIVGPRPLPCRYLPYYTTREHKRHKVRPGLTGLAQVSGRNALSWTAKFEHDLKYIDELSFINDLKIVLLTVKKVFVRDGIGQGEQAPTSLHIERADWLDENGRMKSEFEDMSWEEKR